MRFFCCPNLLDSEDSQGEFGEKGGNVLFSYVLFLNFS